MMNPAFERELARLLENVTSPPAVYVDWCERDSVALAESMDVKSSIERLLPRLRAAGGSVVGQELPGGYGWEMMSTQTEAILARFLPIDRQAR